MQPRRRLIQNVERLARLPAAQLRRQLDPLRLAAAQRRRLLPEPQIAQAHFRQRHRDVVQLRHRAKKRHRLIHRQVQHVRDVHALVGDLERGPVVAPPVARLARDVHRRQKVHLDFEQPIALALLATPALHVETEPPRLVTAHLRRWQFREQIANLVEHPRVGRRIAPRRPPNRRLIDHDHLVDVFESANLRVQTRPLLRAVKLPKQRAPQNVIHQRALPRPAHARHARQRPERNARRHILQIVLSRSDNLQPLALRERPHALLRHRDFQLALQIFSRQRVRIRQHLRHRARRDDFAALHARARPEIEHVIRAPNRVLVMLDHEHRVPQIAQPLERFQQPLIVALMQPDAWFIQNVNHPHQPRANLRRQPNPLRLAAAQRPALAVQREIAQAHIPQKPQPRQNLPHHLVRDFLLELRQLQPRKKFHRCLHRQPAHVHDRPPREHHARARHLRRERRAAQRHRENLRLQPPPVARVARLRTHETLQPVPRELALRLLRQPRQIRQHALEHARGFARLARAKKRELDLRLTRPVQQHLAKILR